MLEWAAISSVRQHGVDLESVEVNAQSYLVPPASVHREKTIAGFGVHPSKTKKRGNSSAHAKRKALWRNLREIRWSTKMRQGHIYLAGLLSTYPSAFRV